MHFVVYMNLRTIFQLETNTAMNKAEIHAKTRAMFKEI